MDEQTLEKMKKKAQKVNWVEVVVNRFRQGQIVIRVDFAKRILSWRDSNRWYNDFTRNIRDDQVQSIRHELLPLLAEARPPEGIACDPNLDYSWCLSLGLSEDKEPSLFSSGADNKNPDWLQFIKSIENTADQLVDPIGGH